MALTILVFVLIGNTVALWLLYSKQLHKDFDYGEAAFGSAIVVCAICCVNAALGYFAYFIITNVGALS